MQRENTLPDSGSIPERRTPRMVSALINKKSQTL
jgi:hypothetical protein